MEDKLGLNSSTRLQVFNAIHSCRNLILSNFSREIRAVLSIKKKKGKNSRSVTGSLSLSLSRDKNPRGPFEKRIFKGCSRKNGILWETEGKGEASRKLFKPRKTVGEWREKRDTGVSLFNIRRAKNNIQRGRNIGGSWVGGLFLDTEMEQNIQI